MFCLQSMSDIVHCYTERQLADKVLELKLLSNKQKQRVMNKKCSWIRVLINNTDEQRSKGCACIFQSSYRLFDGILKLSIVKKARAYDQDFKHLSVLLFMSFQLVFIYLSFYLLNSSSLLFFYN